MKTIDILKKVLYQKSCYEFVKAFWQDADPKPLIDGDIVQYFCEVFQYKCIPWTDDEYYHDKIEISENNIDIIDVRSEKRNLCINIPPRHSKSMIFNVLAPIWLWLKVPIKIASISHTHGLAAQMNDKRTRVITSDHFQHYFGDEKWLYIKNKRFIDTRGGELYAMSRDTMTGYGADVIINDDLTNAETARRNGNEMLSAWSYYRNTMPSRINDRRKYLIMNIQQRLAQNDITGHILADTSLSEEYTFISLPAIFSKTTYLIFPLSGKIKKYNKNDSLWPERFGDYKSLRLEVGENVFQTQYLQQPLSSDDAIISIDMINSCNINNIIDMNYIEYASHDFPIKDKDTSDYLGSVIGKKVGNILYIIDACEMHSAFNKSIEYVTALSETHPGIIQIIEDKANGSPILQQLQSKISSLIAYQPGTNSKSQRLESASLYLLSKNVIFVKTDFDALTNTWRFSKNIQLLIDRLLAFPNVIHDDVVDAFSMLVLYVFMTSKYLVYAKSFSVIDNILDNFNNLKFDSKAVFVTYEDSVMKAVSIGVRWEKQTIIYIADELLINESFNESIKKLQEHYKRRIFIDCSEQSLSSINGISFEQYRIKDFEKSIELLQLAFAKRAVLITKDCINTISDIQTFRYTKQKFDELKYSTTHDGFCKCIRTAIQYYGVITR